MNRKRCFCLLVLAIVGILSLTAQINLPCEAVTQARLNVRTGPATTYHKIALLPKGTTVIVTAFSDDEWVKINYGNDDLTGYVSSQYLSFIEPAPDDNLVNKASSSSHSWSFFGIIFAIISMIISLWIGYVVLMIILRLLGFQLALLLQLINIVLFPFWITNTLQRYLAKPWFWLFKYGRYSDETNEILRNVFSWLKVPFYIALFPLRIINAIVFNIILHCLYEQANYVIEVLAPSSYDEGYGNFWKWVYMFPARVFKYILWHGTLTFIESLIWTVIDTFLPALTLFHGTTPDFAESIVSSPGRGQLSGKKVGLWYVGPGNYAGDGIYFAPARRTALNYSSGVIIVCRVTLGRTIDLGLAPYLVYRFCGHSNAHEATAWGLKNGYVTGEWWRDDRSWWEYCMYDWKNRYNYSWRIRPLYVIYAGTRETHRIPGGMHHWLFRDIVIRDIITSLREFLKL